MAAADKAMKVRRMSKAYAYPKVVATWGSKEGEFSKVEEIYNIFKQELAKSGIQLTPDKTAQGCKMGIVFVTQSFFPEMDDRLRELERMLGSHPYSVIFCDEPDRLTVKAFIDAADPRNYVGLEGEEWDLLREVDALMENSYPTWSYTLLGDTDQARKIARDFMPAANRMFNPKPVEYNNPSLASHVFDLNYKLFVHDFQTIFGDTGRDKRVTLGLFLNQCGCPFCSARIISIHNLLYNINRRCNYDNFAYFSNLPVGYVDDPFAFRKLLFERLYSHDAKPDEGLLLHKQSLAKRIRHLIFIESSDFSPYVFVQQLKNLTSSIGRGSVVIVTASKSTQLFYLEPAKWEVLPTVEGEPAVCGELMRPLYCRMFESDLLAAKTKVSGTTEHQNLQEGPSKSRDKSTKGKKPRRVRCNQEKAMS